ncbi:unnamed protein product [Rotaria sordida]|uniref:PARP n=1 Tax=Rotaria sordida TaxID=392033 RepID=A0A818SGF9_9BILA|nr:unnamed protein product [Rotaria sordida]
MAEAIRETILCQHCNTLINFQDWTEHSIKCLDIKKNRRRNRRKKSVNNESDNERIPCEFCYDQISVDDWNSHSEQCTNAHKCRVENLKNGIDNEPINILVPCEYCNKQVNAHDLEWHTRQCADKYRRQIQKLQNNETTLIPCGYCNAQVNALEWELHTNALHDEVFGTIYSLPKHWDLSALNNLTRYILDLETEEYKFVANNFHQTLPLNQIVQIERIQNRRWYRQYDAHKEDFIERYGKSTERWLFHGCRESRSAEAIIHDCFNRSHAVNCARVLVGRTTVGSSSTRICPPGFDTTGGGNVFVTYHDAQAYGEYLIVYK